MPLDPRTFASSAVAFAGVEDLYHNAAEQVSSTRSDLQSEASQYKGQAGEAFYNLINNLFDSAQTVSDQMGVSSNLGSWSARIAESGLQTQVFVVGLWQ